MIHQPLANASGGTVEAINYMCNERITIGTAKVLKGNPNLTKSIVKSLSFKHKLAVGVLSWEEANIDESLKLIIMNSFEKILLPNMQGRYNILWVEHRDKNRLELNYLIPKIDLPTQKSITPYFDKLDRYRIENWRDIQNIKYGFSDPNDPRKSQTLSNDKRIKLLEDYKELKEQLYRLVSENKIYSREYMIALLNENDIKAKAYKSYITVKLPSSKIAQKLKKGIFDERFRNIRSITEICNNRRRKIQDYNNRNTQELLEKLRNKLDEYTQKKAKYFRKRFIKYRPKDTRYINSEYRKHGKGNVEKIKEKSKNEFFINDSINSYNDNNFTVDFSKLYLKELIYKGKKYDSITAITESIGRERKTQQDSLQRVRETREFIHSGIKTNINNLRREHEEYKERLPSSDFTFKSRTKEAFRRSADYKWEWETLLGAIESITKSTEQVTNEFRKFEQKFEHTIREIRNRSEQYKQGLIEFKRLLLEKRNILIIDLNDIDKLIIDENVIDYIGFDENLEYEETFTIDDLEKLILDIKQKEIIRDDKYEEDFEENNVLQESVKYTVSK